MEGWRHHQAISLEDCRQWVFSSGVTALSSEAVSHGVEYLRLCSCSRSLVSRSVSARLERSTSALLPLVPSANQSPCRWQHDVNSLQRPSPQKFTFDYSDLSLSILDTFDNPLSDQRNARLGDFFCPAKLTKSGSINIAPPQAPVYSPSHTDYVRRVPCTRVTTQFD